MHEMHADSQPPPAAGGDNALADLATRQHGVLARRQLLEHGLGRGAIAHRIRQGRLHRIHAGVYTLGHRRLSQRGHWLAAVLACGEGALLSHASAAALWGLRRSRSPIEVTSTHGRRGQRGIVLHKGRVDPEERASPDGIPATTVARTLFDLAEVDDYNPLRHAWEEADRLHLLQLRLVEDVCARGRGRRALRPIRRLLAEATAPAKTRSPLEDRFASFCHAHRLPPPATNVLVLDHEVDALWPAARLIVELDSFEFHRHRAAFERDRARDTRLLLAGYRTVRITHRRLDTESAELAAQLRLLLTPISASP
jgi:predicted transcriptional regulator of viral defense system